MSKSHITGRFCWSPKTFFTWDLHFYWMQTLQNGFTIISWECRKPLKNENKTLEMRYQFYLFLILKGIFVYFHFITVIASTRNGSFRRLFSCLVCIKVFSSQKIHRLMLIIVVTLINVVFGYLTFESNLLPFLLALINGHLRPFNTLHYKLSHEICWQAEKSCLVLGHQGVVLQKCQLLFFKVKHLCHAKYSCVQNSIERPHQYFYLNQEQSVEGS